jgi:RNA polymerase sigma-70 factor (ECF subfamily)
MSSTTDFSALYRKHASDVHRFALYLCGERAEAEDITSETFVRAWAAPEPIEMATVKGFLFTIARNLYLQRRRGQWRHARLDEAMPDPRAGPLDHVEKKSELDSVMTELQKLPEIDRAALLMRAFEEVPYEEIAKVLGISVSAAKVKVHRARLKLAEVRDAGRPSATPATGGKES